MTTGEMEAALRAFNRRRPFVPYLIQLISGDRLVVVHPETVLLYPTQNLYIYRHPSGRQHVFTAESVCQLCDDEI